MNKLLIADDHQIFNDGLKLLLSHDFIVVEQVFHGNAVLPAVQHHRPDIILLDINLPGQSGLDIAKEIKRSFSKTKIVFLSMYNEINFVKAAQEISANAYLLKDSSGQEILNALKRVENGETIFDEKWLAAKPNLHHDDYFVKQFALSRREVEVIGLVRQGLSSELIASRLAIGFETVRSHRKNIFLKLNISKTSELIAFAVEHQIL